jgi:thiamine pyrophosphate-dependent acetolactate synthase large subunit-like protein
MHRSQMVHYGSRFIGTELPIPNLANIAGEFGAHSERIIEPGGITPAVRKALDSGRPSLLEVMIDNSAECLAPPHLV